MDRFARFGWIVGAIVVGSAAAIAPHVLSRTAQSPDVALDIAPGVGMPGGPPTSPVGLQQRISEMEDRLRSNPEDVGAAVMLSDALLRRARATGDIRPSARAAVVLQRVLQEHPGQYDALRLSGAVLLSLHRFREAVDVARRARDQRPDDAWNYGVIGDALVELGEYDSAFQAYDRMMSLRPNAGAYARVAYARELRGDVDGALEVMHLAADATPPHDPEARAWYATQIGELHLKRGQLVDADREYRRAAFLYPDYPLARVGQARVTAARGDRDGALVIYLEELKRSPTVDLAMRIGDLYAERGNANEAEHYYQLAEAQAGPPIAQTDASLALALADRGRKLPEAVAIAESVAESRHDIFTEDALAWAYFKAGRLEEAYVAAQRATRTGSRDAGIVARATAIREAWRQRPRRQP
jgi:tetratricopeptide (TPR) repeat protein